MNYAVGGRVNFFTNVVFVADSGRNLKVASVLDDVEPVLRDMVDIEGSNFIAELRKRRAIVYQQECVIRVGN